MGKHHSQFAVMVRPTFSAKEILVGMPFEEEADANAEAQRLYAVGNYETRVMEYNPNTGDEIHPSITSPSLYLDHSPLV